jgi:phage terminase large subunit-like protein
MSLLEYQKLIPNYDIFATASEGEYFDEKAGQKPIDFIQSLCRHVKGELAGQLIKLEPWQKGYLSALYGWKRKDGTRRFRESMFFVPRKNGKTIVVACLGLFEFFSGEKGSETYIGASTRDQASICWKMAEQMIYKDDNFRKRCKIYTSSKTFETPDGSVFRAISSDAPSAHGLNTSMGLIDELHSFSPVKGAELVEAIATSMGVRKQPLLIYLTTSDSERAGSVCNERHEYASKVRDGIIHDSGFLPLLFEADRDDDWSAVETWEKANPNLGVSVSYEFLERECKKAKESPVLENSFKRLYLNIRTEQDTRWLSMDKWDSCNLGGNINELKGQVCYGGLDLASVSDLISLTLVFPDMGNAVLNFNFLPRETANKRSEKNSIAYLEWAKEGFIELTSGNVADYDFVRKRINELNELYNIKQLAIDRWNAQDLITKLSDDGFDVVPFGQGYGSMSAPTKETERLVLSGALNHYGNPVLRWSASNASVKIDPAGNEKLSKETSNEKIDPMIALVMAIGLMILDESDKKFKSVYEKRGFISI